MKKHKYFIFLISILLFNCNKKTNNSNIANKNISKNEIISNFNLKIDTTYKTIHVFVALCDNKYQGIVPVPAKIGNGQDPNNNLYWGCGYGIKTYFKKSKEWTYLKSQKKDSLILERIIFKHKTKKYFLVADAYNGKHIKKCTKDFLHSCSGNIIDHVEIENKTIGIVGKSDLVAYIGHDGLMDFEITETFKNKDKKKRNVIILACYSKRFFKPHLEDANVNPLVWTTGLMAPEAYTVHDAITGYINNETNAEVQKRAALAYSKYQKCSVKAASNLLVTGF